MDRIELFSLKFSYFKGLISFNLQADGADTDVYGDNAAGKTTLFDGFYWLLFDKDSRDKAQPEKWIKTLDESGNPLSGVEHEVEGLLLINGQRRTLRKVFSEKWTKKRGTATAEFTGHKTDYFIDGAPLNKGEYNAEIARIIDEDKFKLLTSPHYFNEQLDWKKRRQLLLEVCGDVTDQEVIESNDALSALPGLMEGRTLDRHRDKIKADQTRVNKELADIPVRISEVQRGMPATGGIDEQTAQQQLEALRGRIQGKDAERTRIQSGGEISVKTNRLREIEGELLQLKNTIQAGGIEKIAARRQVLSKERGQAAEIEDRIKRTERQIESLQRQVAENVEGRNKLRADLKAVKEREFAHNCSDSCPTCGQALPEDEVAASIEKAQQQFNSQRSEQLEHIQTMGRGMKAQADEWEKEISNLTERLKVDREALLSAQSVAAATDEIIKNLQVSLQDVDTDPAYIAKLQERSDVEQEIRELRSSAAGVLESSRMELAKLRTEAEALERNLARFEQVRAGKARIEALKDQEKQLAREYEGLEMQLHLTEEFIRTKVRMLEDRINAKFKSVRFKLFETQVNGAVNEVCETLYGPNLVPYGNGLNRAAQINAGLDIINTLSEHYGLAAPIFIDNAEAVTQLAETAGQQIRLIVSKDDKQLRVANN
ncbi:hypothetical protein [Paenibacillus sp. GCM10027626]|uniref:hypothetical protein n=1 Tax=Paenibacillus sp. GCM10027626 TaxID=3273411 RepID=UPI00363E1695